MAFREWLAEKILTIILEANVKNLLSKLSGYKTYITGSASILISVASLFGLGLPGIPAIGHDAAVQTIVTSLIGIFLRHGISTSSAAAGAGK